MLKTIVRELREHVPFTFFGTLTGVVLMVIVVRFSVPRGTSEHLFNILHPFHVFLSALVTAGMYRLHGKGRLWATVLIGYVGAVGIATLSDSLIPYAGEWLLGLDPEPHVGFIEKWWIVNPLAAAGILVAWFRPRTKFPHAGHVLLSTWASLFHMTMALGEALSAGVVALMAAFLFLAVWVPCCLSDIVFPLLFSSDGRSAGGDGAGRGHTAAHRH
jgi:hypothetical protein